MKEIIIDGREAGIRLDKFLEKLLPHAGRSFLYKMLRKKNITLNGKKAEGSERLCAQDKICIFFSDETYAQFRFGGQTDGRTKESVPVKDTTLRKIESYVSEIHPFTMNISVIYEDRDMLIADKPAGILTQRAEKTDNSLNDWLCGHVRLDKQKRQTGEERLSYTPSAVNRLDRNTSGLVLCAKTYQAARALSSLIHDRKIGKYYLALVKGKICEPKTLKGFLRKDSVHNQVMVSEDGTGEEIHTAYAPLFYLDRHDMTLLKVELITGKPHQIRAHLAGISHPVCGDPKYGDAGLNRELHAKYGVNRQLLHAFAVCFPAHAAFGGDRPMAVAGKTFLAPLPQDFGKLLDPYHIGESVWQRGIQEGFEVPPLRI